MKHASGYLPGGITGREIRPGEWWSLNRSGMGHLIARVEDGVVLTSCGLTIVRSKLRPAPSVMKCRKCEAGR